MPAMKGSRRLIFGRMLVWLEPLPVSGMAMAVRGVGKGGEGRRALLTYLIPTTNCAAKFLKGNFKSRQESRKQPPQ